jgi:hypothetical protein
VEVFEDARYNVSSTSLSPWVLHPPSPSGGRGDHPPSSNYFSVIEFQPQSGSIRTTKAAVQSRGTVAELGVTSPVRPEHSHAPKWAIHPPTIFGVSFDPQLRVLETPYNLLIGLHEI